MHFCRPKQRTVNRVALLCDRVLFYFVCRDEKVIRRPKRSRNPATAQARRGFYGAESLQSDTHIPGGIYVLTMCGLNAKRFGSVVKTQFIVNMEQGFPASYMYMFGNVLIGRSSANSSTCIYVHYILPLTIAVSYTKTKTDTLSAF